MTLVFWTLNVPATLTVGFTRRGETVMAPQLVCRHDAILQAAVLEELDSGPKALLYFPDFC